MNKYIGDKKFYKMVLAIAVPIMIQNGFTNLINLLDNLMVGLIGTDQMSGVAIVNQLLFVFNLSVFGGLSGAGIFMSQYYGKGDTKNMKNVFRMKGILAILIMSIGILVLLFGGNFLIDQFLHKGGMTGNIEATRQYALDYLLIMMIGLVPFAISQWYASSLREVEQTILPMRAGIIGVLVNLSLNYILIFGRFGLPKLGVRGAAIATVISRFVECLIILLWTQKHHKEYSFMTKLFYEFELPGYIVQEVIKKGLPLLLNEFLWASAMTMLTRSYSTRGLAAVAGINICNTINNVFNIGFIALGSSVSIVVGQRLGAGKIEEAKDYARKMIAFSVVFCMGIGFVMAMLAPIFPLLYNTTDEVRHLAMIFIIIMAILMPFCAFTNASYFTLRSGGRTGITFLFDSCYAWVVCVPIATILSQLTSISVVWLYFICQSLEIFKCFIGYALVKKGIWVQQLSKD